MKFARYFAGGWLFLLAVVSLVVRFGYFSETRAQNADLILKSPSLLHIFGTDSLGRDLFLRLFAGSEVSLSVGIFGSLIALVVGVLYGMAAGWCGGWTDKVLTRATDVMISIPSFVLVAVLSLAFQKLIPIEDPATRTLVGLIVAIGLAHWLNIARVTRVLVQQSKVLPFVEAARAMGAGHLEILRRHVLPNIIPQLLVLLGLQIPANILYESFMSFIGVGVQPPQTSWGLLMQEGWKTLSEAPHMMLFPALILFLTVWSLNLILDELATDQI